MTTTDDMFFDKEIDSDYKCAVGHPLRLVAEGYAICHAVPLGWWWAWRMTPPPPQTKGDWGPLQTRRGGVVDGYRWISPQFPSREEAIDYIRRDIEAHRNLPFDEAAERSRLMPI